MTGDVENIAISVFNYVLVEVEAELGKMSLIEVRGKIKTKCPNFNLGFLKIQGGGPNFFKNVSGPILKSKNKKTLFAHFQCKYA